ncbi:hypothetical protein ACHWQZ_G010873 [Mnemiopsis leidyi]
MGFTRGAGHNAVQNKFVSMISKPYRWDSSGGPVINNPVPMEKFPNIKRTMDRLNTTFGYSLNCCLVSYYKNGQKVASLPVIARQALSSPLSPVIVKPLAQLVDFGKFLPSKPVVFKLNPAPVPEQLTSERRNLSPSLVTEHLTSDRRKPLPNNKPLNLSSIHSPVSPGYAPFPSQSHDEHTVSANTQSRSNNNEKVCVIFGTSITELVDGTLLSKKNRTVVNISSSGANINDIQSMANDFHHENL